MDAAPKIMVVDDEKNICKNVEKILKKNNYEIVHATSADEALEKMAKDSFSLLISDIVMPGKNGLELLKMVKAQWPLTKAVMMTAYASTDTAMKAIRLGALDYIPKPFTPDELRGTVEQALQGDLVEVKISPEERESINIIDLDIPFDREEVAKHTGEDYADMLGPSDMPVVEVRAPETLEGFCEVGDMVCDIFKKLGATCKAGTKTAACPQKKAKKKKAKAPAQDVRKLVGIDQPFIYDEVVAVTGPEYIQNLSHDGVSVPLYEELKRNVARLDQPQKGKIAVDVPFDRAEVAAQTGEAYADQLGRSDMPVVEVIATEPLEGFCEVGDMVCDIFKKLGATCKAGTKTAACPQKKAKKKKGAKKAVDTSVLIAPDMPFVYEEVAAVTGPEYVAQLVYDGTVQIPYEQLKKNMAPLLEDAATGPADVIELRKVAGDRHVLVIDDEAGVNNNIRKILGKKGFEVDQALTREEALEKIHSHTYPVVLLDLKIPGVTGLELLEAIRYSQPEARVIIITGYASIETAVGAARMGAVGYVPKPFTPDEIRDATANAMAA